MKTRKHLDSPPGIWEWSHLDVEFPNQISHAGCLQLPIQAREKPPPERALPEQRASGEDGLLPREPPPPHRAPQGFEGAALGEGGRRRGWRDGCGVGVTKWEKRLVFHRFLDVGFRARPG
eukprot:5775131-Alexandrium_andersonii.AAC.1